MDMKAASVATIAGDAEVDHAVATLVLAFATDPVARWMYDDPHQYLLHIPELFRALGASSFKAAAAQRTADGFGVALWLPPGVHGDDGPLEAIISESVVGEKQAEVAVVFERTEHYRGITAASPRPMRPEAPSRLSLVIEPAKYISLREAWL